MSALRRGIQSGIGNLQRNIFGSQCRCFWDYAPEPFHPIPNKFPLVLSAEEAVKHIKSDQTVFVQGSSATPNFLVNAMTEHGKAAGLKNVKVCHIHTEGPGSYMEPDCDGIFRAQNFFTAANARKAVNEGRADAIPVFLSEIPLLFRRELIDPDVALVSLTPPDKHGYCSLGSSIDITRAALQKSEFIIGQVNKNLPRTFGDGFIHVSHIDALVYHDAPMPQMIIPAATEEDVRIGKYIAQDLVEDGATLQMGIGAIPDAALAQMKNHQNLGIHTEMFSDRVVDLVEVGAISNTKKAILPGKILSSFVIGTQKVFDFIDDNPFVILNRVDFVNHTSVIMQNPKVTAINSCIEVDLSGQVCSDSIGTRVYSGVGGQIDFIRGAALGTDGRGKPIIAVKSTTNKGASKIVPTLKEGAGVVTTRSHVHYVVTEWGVAFLFGKNYRQRAYHLIQIAHPDHREWLEKEAFNILKCLPSPD